MVLKWWEQLIFVFKLKSQLIKLWWSQIHRYWDQTTMNVHTLLFSIWKVCAFAGNRYCPDFPKSKLIFSEMDFSDFKKYTNYNKIFTSNVEHLYGNCLWAFWLLIPKLFRGEDDLSWSLEQVIWTFLFSVIVVIAIMGNAMVLWIILAHRTMWSVPNYFLLNLTIADLLMAALNCVPRWNISIKMLLFSRLISVSCLWETASGFLEPTAQSTISSPTSPCQQGSNSENKDWPHSKYKIWKHLHKNLLKLESLRPLHNVLIVQ